MQRRKRNVWRLSIVMALLVSTVAGCGGRTETSDAPKETKLMEVSMMLPLFVAEAPKSDSEYLQKIEAYTNSKLTLNWVPNTNYDDKLNVLLASGEMPKAIVTQNIKLPAIINAARSGAFWEIGPFLKDYPNLNKLPELGWRNTAIDGKQYGIYRYRDAARDGIVYRKDWLDNLGLKEPATIDELYNVLKAFATKDPDKNGKDDTYGLIERSNLYSFRVLAAYFGAPVDWEQKNGKFTPAYQTDAFMKALKFFKKLYDERILNPDFGTLKSANDTIFKGKAGSTFVTIDNAVSFERETKKVDPGSKFDVLQRLSGEKGARIPTYPGHNGVILFPKSSVKSEAELKQLLSFFNKLGDEAMMNLIYWGIEGKTYKVENGKNTFITSTVSDEQTALPQITVYPSPEDKAVSPLDAKILKSMRKDSLDIAYVDPTAPLISKTNSEKGTELKKIMDDAVIKFVMGKIDEVGFKAEADKSSKSGGDQIAKEYEEEFAKLGKK